MWIHIYNNYIELEFEKNGEWWFASYVHSRIFAWDYLVRSLRAHAIDGAFA
jgi:hypothetical protein